MTKREIANLVSTELGVTQSLAKQIVQRTFDLMIDSLVQDGRIELRNFGVFEVAKRAARRARNPRTGEQVVVPEKLSVKFVPGKEMEKRVAGCSLVTDKVEAREPVAVAVQQIRTDTSLP